MDSPGVRLQVYNAILLESPDRPFPRRAVSGVGLGWDPESIDVEVPRQEQPRRPAQGTKEREAAASPLRARMHGDLGVLEENKLTWSMRRALPKDP